VNYQELRRKLISDAAKQNIPILGEFELTGRCNLRCKMCYVVDQNAKDLSTDNWKHIFNDAKDAGLLFALLTGGEIFIRDDFITLYNYLYDLGVRITLFSNGIYIPDSIIEALTIRPPEYIALTLYGANDDTYRTVTSHTTGFTTIDKNIKKLLKANINTVLRTIPLVPIYEDLEAMINYVKSLGMTLSYTEYIGPTRTGAFAHKALRLDPEDLLKFSQTINQAFTKSSHLKEPINLTTKPSTCAALKSAYFINYQGYMQPCAMAYKPVISVLDNPLNKAFKDLGKTLASMDTFKDCLSCSLKSSCLTCYARRLLENDLDACPPYLKAYAILKKHRVK
jgi:radical SAM protein with 4Fe4S-binding SPASM domain